MIVFWVHGIRWCDKICWNCKAKQLSRTGPFVRCWICSLILPVLEHVVGVKDGHETIVSVWVCISIFVSMFLFVRVCVCVFQGNLF